VVLEDAVGVFLPVEEAALSGRFSRIEVSLADAFSRILRSQ